jgi:3-phosphoshikimate 1-carboxyvinyltransferase
MKIIGGESIRGNIKVPGDKSISHRLAIVSAICEGTSRIDNFSRSQDCQSTLECLKNLGINIRKFNGTVEITSQGIRSLQKPETALDCGNSGTTMRLLSGVLAASDTEATLIGDQSLSRRPMKRIIEPLEMMGAQIESKEGFAPLEIKGKPLSPIEYTLPVASAQVKSAILLAGLNTKGETTVIEPAETRDHTERLFKFLKAPLQIANSNSKKIFKIKGPFSPAAFDAAAPGDISSAAFFIAAAIGLKGSEISIESVGINPTRTAFIGILQNFGADIELSNKREICGEPVADIIVRWTEKLQKHPLRVDGPLIPNLIDELPILGVLGTRLPAGLEVRDAYELRHKESDRISAVVQNLKKMGAKIEELEDGFIVAPSRLEGAEIETFGDHRIAMAFAVAALFAEGETVISNAECANVSFPGFYDELEKLLS